ncbi:hypothetical protein SAMN06296386_11411 [Lachnospiraceae bacterium]|nr:hypothetical protein SAMN06296386_11411 [Lachnospiraceae bacterium]
MKVQNIRNIDNFFEVINKCKGRVEMVTDEGDRLNLKSRMTQYVSLAKLFSNDIIPEIELVAYEPEDVKRLVNFMMNDN